MFTQISWSLYTIIVIVFLAGYYLFVGLKYYREDILQLLSGKTITSGDTANSTPAQPPLIKPDQSLPKLNMQETFEKQNFFQLTKSLADEIQAFLNEAGGNKITKEEVITSLQLLLSRYPALKDSSFKEFLQNLIETECETNCSVHLSEEELSALWIR